MSSTSDCPEQVLDTTGLREPQQSIAVAILRAAAEGLLAVESADAMVARLRAHALTSMAATPSAPTPNPLTPPDIRPNRRV